ncbi:MAG TPA: ATP-binding protein [bacterium]|nr:ATP-binding protein [bacterium]
MKKISREELQRKLKVLNPHWENSQVDDVIRKYKKRSYFDLLFPLVSKFSVNRAVILMGPRRVGKTVLLYQIIEEFIRQGEDPKNFFYVSLDVPLLHGLSLDELIQLYLEIFPGKKIEGTVIIFDEVQYLGDWDIHLKVLVDHHPQTRFIASGSAAAALKRKSRESGAGRFTDFMLPPLTFYEYLDLLDLRDVLLNDRGYGSPPEPKDIDGLNREFINYLNYGGFPEAIFNPDIQKAPDRYLRSDIIDKVLLRDLPSLYGIHDVQELNKLFGALAYQTGNEVTYESLSGSGIAKNTIKRYIDYLEAAFLIKTVKRIDDSGKMFQRTNYFKVYLTNPCMYSALFDLVDPEDSQTLGNLVETAIFSQWLHSPEVTNRIHYARWNGGKGEVDIVFLNPQDKVAWCVEVKWSDRFVERPMDLKSLLYFCGEHGLKTALVTTKSKRKTENIGSGFKFEFVESAIYCYAVGRNSIYNKKTLDGPEEILRAGDRITD